ncbi:dormancy-associated protein 2-like [Vicia villosa]|uniref:dormancy-associated protein 2-like n=1 Tax=Vicia villosa TaxID=3911 RepID=UPI00273C2D3B|nr:dormancy-associated protein 2-like [Vicia villosa]
MNSRKSIVILGLLSLVLFISSQVSARNLFETSTYSKDGQEVVEKSHEINKSKYVEGGNSQGGSGHVGVDCEECCFGSHIGGHCRSCCRYAGEAVAVKTKDNTRN